MRACTHLSLLIFHEPQFQHPKLSITQRRDTYSVLYLLKVRRGLCLRRGLLHQLAIRHVWVPLDSLRITAIQSTRSTDLSYYYQYE